MDADHPDYFERASTYIHLNPARSGLIRIGEERLKSYRWSSYPWHLVRAGGKPEWLESSRVLGCLRLRHNDAKGYEAYLEGRVLELGDPAGAKALAEQWKALRRGWYLGEVSFAEKLITRLRRATEGRRRESHSGPARLAHDLAAAEQRLAAGMRALGLNETAVRNLPKGAPEKLALAWWLREHTTVTLRWVAQRLGMGHYTRVTQAISRVSRRPSRELARLQRRLEALQSF